MSRIGLLARRDETDGTNDVELQKYDGLARTRTLSEARLSCPQATGAIVAEGAERNESSRHPFRAIKTKQHKHIHGSMIARTTRSSVSVSDKWLAPSQTSITPFCSLVCRSVQPPVD